MALSYPLPLAEFFDGLRVRSVVPDLPRALVTSRTRGGDLLRVDIADRLWTARVEIAASYHGEAEEVRARLRLLGGADGTLLAHPYPLYGPRADPVGAILGAVQPTLHAVAANMVEVQLAGLPPGYRLSVGDFLSFTYGGGPTRYGLHQIVAGGVADGDGRTPNIQVVPEIRPGAVTGSVVRLIKPLMKCIVVEDDPGTSDPAISDGIAFSIQQTLRN